MANMDDTDQIMTSVSDIRHRLMLTEQSLQNLNSMQDYPVRYKHHVSRDLGASPESDRARSLTMDDLSLERERQPFMVLRERVPSPRLSSPKSRTVFASDNVHSNLSQRSLVDDVEVVSSSKSSSISKLVEFDEENLTLRRKLQQLRDKNSQLVSQNHSLLNQLEDGCHQLRKAQAKVEQLTAEMGEMQENEERLAGRISELEDEKILMERETQFLGEKLRLSDGKVKESEKTVDELKKEICTLNEKLAESDQLKNRAEHDCKNAIQTAEKLKTAYERYQKKMEGKLNERQSTESHLTESMRHLSQERETLLKTCQSLKEQVGILMEENQHLADNNLMEKEQRCQMEAANLDLKMTHAKTDHKIAELEKQVRKENGLKEEIIRLRQVSREQEGLLKEYEQKLENTSHHSASDNADEDSNESKKSTQAFTEVISQLSQQLAAKEGEIQALKLSSSVSSASKSENIHESAESPVEDGASKDCSKEVAALERKNLDLVQQVNDLNEEQASLAIKLQHRAGQVEELQKDLEANNKQLSSAHRELRKTQSQLTTSEQQLNEKVYEVTRLMAQSTEVDDQLDQQKKALDASRRDLQLEKRNAAEVTAAMKDMQALHQRQCEELQTQVEKLQVKWQTSADEQEGNNKRITTLENQLQIREEHVLCLTQELNDKTQEAEMMLSELHQKTTHDGQRIADLESTLVVSKQELTSQAEQTEKLKLTYEMQLSQIKEKCKEVEENVNLTTTTLKSKENQVTSLERDISERQNLLEAANTRLEELEESLQASDAQICSLERQLEDERNKTREEDVRHEHKQKSADEEMARKEAIIQSMRLALDESERNAQNLKLTTKSLEEHVKTLKANLKKTADISTKLEADNKLTKDQVDEQMTRVKSLEGELCQKRNECNDKVERIAALNSELAATKKEITRLEVVVLDKEQHSKMLAVEKERTSKLTQLLRQKDDDVRGKACTIQELETELQQRQRELEQRVTQMTQLDMAIKEHNSGTEQRLIRLEAALKKSQVESMQRSQQIITLDEQLQAMKSQLQEKDLQLQQASQSLDQMSKELQRSRDNCEQFEKYLTEAGRQSESLRAENSQLKQELILSRNDYQKINQNSDDLHKDFSMSQRDIQRLKSEIDDLRAQLKYKESDNGRLTDEISIWKTKETQAKTSAEVEARKFSRQIDLLKEQHAQEVAGLQKTQSLIVTSQKEMGTSFQIELDKLRTEEQSMKQEILQLRATNEHLKEEKAVGDSLLIKANEDIILKESASVRLEAKISSLQRSLCQLSRSEGPSFGTPSQSTTLLPDQHLPEMDISSISSAHSDKDSFQKMLQDVNANRENEKPVPKITQKSQNSAEQLIMGKSQNADKNKTQNQTQAKSKKKSTIAKHKIPKPKVKLGSSHPKNKPAESGACVENVRERLQALMGKVNTMTVEEFAASEHEETSDDDSHPDLQLVMKKYSPELPEKSFEVCSAVQHYEQDPPPKMHDIMN